MCFRLNLNFFCNRLSEVIKLPTSKLLFRFVSFVKGSKVNVQSFVEITQKW